MSVCESEGRTYRPAFATARGNLADPGDYNALLRRYVSQVQEATDLVDESKEVDSTYSSNCTLRRTLQTCLIRAGLAAFIQEAMNCWRKVNNVKGKSPRFNMCQLFAEAYLKMPVTWLCSYVLWVR